ncbi:MAG: hypothetical protein ACTSXG_04265 [Alphaproteobacteria bacterium]
MLKYKIILKIAFVVTVVSFASTPNAMDSSSSPEELSTGTTRKKAAPLNNSKFDEIVEQRAKEWGISREQYLKEAREHAEKASKLLGRTVRIEELALLRPPSGESLGRKLGIKPPPAQKFTIGY